MKLYQERIIKVSYIERNQFHFLLLKFSQLFMKLQRIVSLSRTKTFSTKLEIIKLYKGRAQHIIAKNFYENHKNG